MEQANEQGAGPGLKVTDFGVHLMAPGAARRLLPLVESVVTDLGFFVVRLRFVPDGAKSVLQLMAERADGNLKIADCEAISRGLSPVLDVEATLGSYVLEVSSPGFTRPLTRPHDFVCWCGAVAKLETTHAIHGQRVFQGILKGFYGSEVRLETIPSGARDPQILGFEWDRLAKARLVADDNALKKMLKSGKPRAAASSIG